MYMYQVWNVILISYIVENYRLCSNQHLHVFVEEKSLHIGILIQLILWWCFAATSNISLALQGVPQNNGGDFIPKTMQAAQTKLETIKHWSFNTFKCTKQLISEKFGKGSKTVDLELETQIETLKDMQRKYANILRLARTLTNHFSQVVQTQRALGEAFAEQSQRNPELQEEFSYNCETQRNLVKNGEVLLGKEYHSCFSLWKV